MDELELSGAPKRKLARLQFGIYGPDLVRSHSVTQEVRVTGVIIPAGVTRPVTFNQAGIPVFGGINDPRMGPPGKGYFCKTCSGDVKSCPGHFGHIELARPVFHIGFLNHVYKVLQCVCFHCGMLLSDESDPAFRAAISSRPSVRLNEVLRVCRGKKVCRARRGGGGKKGDGVYGLDDGVRTGCEGMQPKFKRQGYHIQVEFDQRADMPASERSQTLFPQKALEILRLISDEDARLLGFDPRFARPDWMVVTVLPVAPPPVRPAVMTDGAARGEDDLTYKYADIVRSNEALLDGIRRGEPPQAQEEFLEQLQYHCATLLDNELASVAQSTQRGGRPLKTLRSRLKGKYGRVRGNLMGKRVNFSGRSVITPDPNLGIDQVGVPISIARSLTFPERVTRWNYEQLNALVRRGAEQYPGANYIVRPDGAVTDLRHVRDLSSQVIDEGWVVERHIRDDDLVLFNRQPSLHKMSIMGHRVKVMSYSTFRLNLSVTAPYNADFDGDEMNLHVPQTLTAKAEVASLMMVPRNVVSPQSNKPVMGIVQDSLLGTQKMTKRDVFLTRAQMMTLCMFIDDWDGKMPTPAIMVPDPRRPGRYEALWTGKQAFSMILPNVNLVRKSNGCPKGETEDPLVPSDRVVLIENGTLLHGIVDKATVGTSGGGLIHVVSNDFGHDATRLFMNGLQKLVNNWLLMRGFTIGAADTVADRATVEQIVRVIDDSKASVKELVKKGQQGDLQLKPGRTMMQMFEQNVNEVLNSARTQSGSKAERSLDERNNIKATVTAGSKGSNLNISQIMACVGQQNVNGQRIPYGFRNRTLPHFQQYDLGPESRGFVENSYLKGLSPQEFFFHAMGGREGLIDTAVKTAETGYIQRRLIKAMEDMMVQYDGTVRNSNGQVLQFLYGEDGMDGRWIEAQPFRLNKMKRAEFDDAFKFDIDSPFFGRVSPDSPVYYLSPDVIAQMRTDQKLMELLESELEQLEADREDLRVIMAASSQGEDGTQLQVPVNLGRLVRNAQKQFRLDLSQPSDMGPGEVVEGVRRLQAELLVVPGADPISVEAQHDATLLFSIMLRSTLASKQVLRRYRLSQEAFEWLLGEVRTRFQESRAHAGEMCGIVAAQSIGECVTQMTLNTFHFAGVSSKNVTLGVPRLREIINVAKTVKAPSLVVHLREDVAVDQSAVNRVISDLQYITLRQLAESSAIWWDPDPSTTVVEEDKELVHTSVALVDEEDLRHQSPWVLRFVLSAAMVDSNHVDMNALADLVRTEFDGKVNVIVSDKNADVLVMRLRIAFPTQDDEDDGGADVETLKSIEDRLLRSVRIRGVPGITKVYNAKTKLKTWTPERGFQEKEVIYLETDGTNLMQVMAHPAVDHTRTVSNHVVEVFEVLGIEAARASLLRELRQVMEFYGLYINYRHLAVLVDSMTFRGHLMAVSRHGINRVDTGVLQRASFEETVELLMDAAVHAEDDLLGGVSENIMLGQMCPVGTGCFDLLLDDEAVGEAIVVEPTQEFMPEHGMGMGMGMAGGATPGGMTPHIGAGGATPGAMTPGGMTPYDGAGGAAGGASVWSPAQWSPMHTPGGGFSPGNYATTPAPTSPYAPASGMYSPSSPGGMYSPSSPGAYSPTSPNVYSPTSPAMTPTSPGGMYSPTSPAGASPTSPAYSPNDGRSPASPQYSPTSPGGGGGGMMAGGPSPVSPQYSPTSPAFSPSDSRSPASPQYSPTSPAFSPSDGSAPRGAPSSGGAPTYSPTSPNFSPSDSTGRGASAPRRGAPSSGGMPTYSPTSPNFSPSDMASTMTAGAAAAPGRSAAPVSPSYSPTSPNFSPSDMASTMTAGAGAAPGRYGSAAPGRPAAPISPSYSPTSPGTMPPTAPGMAAPRQGARAPISPAYSPTSPGGVASGAHYAPTTTKDRK